MVRVGVISDTHGLLRPQALAQLAGSDYIIHGGDIGNQDILDQLAAIAPLTVVRGNNDRAPWARAIPATAILVLGEVQLYALHNINELAIDPASAGVRAVIYGHSHAPKANWRGNVMYLNPGSAGPRRFKLPVSVAELLVDGSTVSARIIELDI